MSRKKHTAICSEIECDEPAKLRGYCKRHYHHARTANPSAPMRPYNAYHPVRNGRRVCATCQRNKPITDYSRNASNGYLYRSCKECQNAKRTPVRIRRLYHRAKDGYKICPVCEQNKPVTDYAKVGSNGWHAWCKECKNTITREKYAANPDPYKRDSRRSQMKYKYGITIEEYSKLVEHQGGCCAICGDPATGPTSLHVDHDHRCCSGSERTCGKCIRGLLCISCNALLGQAKDDPRRLKKAIAYLERVMPVSR